MPELPDLDATHLTGEETLNGVRLMPNGVRQRFRTSIAAVVQWAQTQRDMSADIAAAVAAYVQAHVADLKGPKGVAGDRGASGAKGDTGAPGAAATTLIGTAAVSQSAPIAGLLGGVRTIADVSVTTPLNGPSLAVGDDVLVAPVGALSAGYALHNAVVTAPNKLSVTLTAPALASLVGYSIAVRVRRLN